MQNLTSPGASFHVDEAALIVDPFSGLLQPLACNVRRLINDDGKFATNAVFHENSNVSIEVCVVISYNVVKVKVLENVSTRCRCQSVVKLQEFVETHTSATISTYNSHSVPYNMEERRVTMVHIIWGQRTELRWVPALI